MLEAVDPVLLRLEGLQGVQEVGNAEAAVGPALEVRDQQVQVLGVVREGRGKGSHRGSDGGDEGRGGRVVAGVGYGTVLDLEGLQGCRGCLELLPFRESAVIRTGAVRAVTVIVARLSGCWERLRRA